MADTVVTVATPAPPPGGPPTPPTTVVVRKESWFRRNWLKMKRAARRMASNTWAFLTAGAGMVAAGARSLWAKASVASAGAVRGVAAVGHGITWLAKTVANALVGASILAVGFQLTVILLVVGVAIWSLTRVISLWNNYVVGFFAYYSQKRPVVGLRTYLRNRKAILDARRERMTNQVIEGVEQWASTSDEVSVEIPEEMQVDQFGDPITPEEVAEDQEYLARWRAQREAEIAAKVEGTLHSDAKKTADEAYPGAGVWVGEDDGSRVPLTPRTKLRKAISDWQLETNKPELEFDFTPYLEESDLRDAFEYFMYDSAVKQEKAYWLGRIEAFDKFKQDPDRLSLHGQWWALTAHKYHSRQAEYPQPALRAGFMSMIEELTKAKTKSKAKANA